MKEVRVVVGANYGDEGKGLLTRHFVKDAYRKYCNPIVIFHNGTAQRGHTIDYNADFRHVYHHFGSGTGDGAPTYYSNSFLIHPMTFRDEYVELKRAFGRAPIAYCDIAAKVITPFDMIIDHATEENIAILAGEREFGSCGYGSWCATDRGAYYTVGDFLTAIGEEDAYSELMNRIWNECLVIAEKRNLNFDKLTNFRKYFFSQEERDRLAKAFYNDFVFFVSKVEVTRGFNEVWTDFDYFVFENGQGLGLDQNVDNEWHTTSNTGVLNPYELLGNRNFNAEVCYVTRSYLTRHGDGPLEEAVKKGEINGTMIDKTNVPNEFQGTLRYGYLGDAAQKSRIDGDFSVVAQDARYSRSIAVTHTNEFKCDLAADTKYYSDNPYSVTNR